jgi:hypothetical protein
VIVITSFPTHREYSGPPVNIIEYQGHYFACSQPQSGQEKNDCIITTTDRSIPIASMEDPFDFFYLKIPWHFRESPCSHAGNGPCEVSLGLPVLEEKPEKRAERRHHQLGHSGAAGTGVPKQETRDVVRGQFPKTNAFSSITFNKETSKERPIPGDRYGRKTAFLPEIVLIPFLQRCQRSLIDRRLRRPNNALLTQVFKEVTDGSRRTFSEASLAAPLLQELCQHLLFQSDEWQMLPLKPPFEVVENPQPLPHRRSGITEFGDSGDERIQVRSQGACPAALHSFRV